MMDYNSTFTLTTYKKRWLKIAIDFAIFTILFAIFHYLVFGNVFDTSKESNLRYQTFINSGLYVDINDNKSILSSDNYQEYENIVKKYYVGKINGDESVSNSYFDTEFYKVNGGLREVKTISWYNENILGLPNSNVFGYKYDEDGNILYDSYGEIKDSLYIIDNGNKTLSDANNELILNYFITKYKVCFEDFFNVDFYFNAYKSQKTKGELSYFVPLVISYSLIYILIPLFLRNKSIGEHILKIEYININGLYLPKYKLLLKSIPFFVITSLIMLGLDFYLYLSFYLIYILINFISSVYSKYHGSLIENICKIVLIDLHNSKIFKSLEEKENYIKSLENVAESISTNYYENGN